MEFDIVERRHYYVASMEFDIVDRRQRRLSMEFDIVERIWKRGLRWSRCCGSTLSNCVVGVRVRGGADSG